MVQNKPNHSRKDEMLVDHLILAVPMQNICIYLPMISKNLFNINQ